MTAPPATSLPPGLRFRLTGPHGRLVGVDIPPPPGPSLPPEEAAHVATLSEARRPSFLAGRLALRLALGDLGLPTTAAILPDPRGAPRLPPGAAGSISHKRSCAVGLAAPAQPDVQVGVDLEEVRPLRMNIAPRVLTDQERAGLDLLTPSARDRFVLERFSLKEAFYKAVNVFVGPTVSFHAVEVDAIGDDGWVVWRAPLLAAHGLVAEGWVTEASGHILTTALIRRNPARPLI